MVINSQKAAKVKLLVTQNLKSALKKILPMQKDYKTDFSFKFELIYANNYIATKIWFFPAKNYHALKESNSFKKTKNFYNRTNQKIFTNFHILKQR